jgi:DAK2 domain fusion protein YloV
VPTAVSAGLVQEWAERALQALGEARQEIDALNVFPVPDGDTGTNLYLTVEAALQEVVRARGASVAEAAAALARGALLGARGNSGVILSQVLRGASEVIGRLPEGEPLDPDSVRSLLRRGAELSYAAVARPVEGTILTVARAAAERAEAQRGDAVAVLHAAVAGAQEALAHTTDQLESLRRAGVVDSGGAGLVVVLRALDETVSGVRRPARLAWPKRAVPESVAGEVPSEPVDYAGPAYEVMFLLDADDAHVADLRAVLDALGDSLVIVGGDRLWNVHVHVEDAGAAIEAALRAGSPSRIRITHLDTGAKEPRTGRAIVAVTHGPGIADLLRQAGVHVIPTAPRAKPSTGEVLEALLQTHAQEVLVLPSDSDALPSVEAAAAEARTAGLRVAVIPSRSVVQTLAAVAVHNPDAHFDADVVSMTRAAGATRYSAVTVATKQALTMAGPCHPGDVLGIVAGDIAVVGEDVEAVARVLLDKALAAGGELVTVVFGSDASDEVRDSFPRWIETAHPLVDVVVHEGGQPLWPMILGVE